MATKITFSFKAGGSPQVIIMDATLQEIYESKADITDFPVEVGSNIADGIRRRPVGLTIDGLVTDFPLASDGRSFTPSSAVFGLARPSAEETRSKSVLATLEKLQEDGVIFKVETGLKQYKDMGLENIRVTRDKTTGNSIRAMLTMKALKIVQSQTVTVVKAGTPKAGGKVSGGKQSAKQSSAANQKKASIFLEDVVKPLQKLYSGGK